MGSPVLPSKYKSKKHKQRVSSSKAFVNLDQSFFVPDDIEDQISEKASLKYHEEYLNSEIEHEKSKLHLVNKLVDKAVLKSQLNNSNSDIFEDQELRSSLPSPTISSVTSESLSPSIETCSPISHCKRQKISNRSQSIGSSMLSTSLTTQQSEFDSQESQSLKRRLRNIISWEPNVKTYDDRIKNALVAKKNATRDLGFDHIIQSVDIGPFFGLPSKVKELFKQHRGIVDLYEWQKECIQKGISGNNLLVSLPTSGGKTLVAEILMLRQILLYQKDVLLILPYVTLVQEKVRGISPFAVDLGFIVEEYAGSKGIFPPAKHRKNVIYIATIEKGSGLIDHLVETQCIGKLGLTVVDEVHMVGDSGGRGAKLESAIVKLKLVAEKAQIVAMSATVGNLSQLGLFLNAELYTGHFRPVPLTEHVKIGNKIAEVNQKAKTEDELFTNFSFCTVPVPTAHKQRDVDCITPLVKEVIPEHSCLVFCATKSNAEAVAKMLAFCLPKTLMKHKTYEKKALLRALKAETIELCQVLRETVPYGIAYHHSGLTEGERKLVEEGYQQGTLSCICCTSTLAAGVNLPARRVIIRSPYIAKDFLTRSRYQQMVGRAGRAGLDSKGESFILSSQQDIAKLSDLLLSPVEKCMSKLHENDNSGLTALVFSVLGLGVVSSLDSVKDVIKQSLLCLQVKELNIDMETLLDDILSKQQQNGFLTINETSQQDSELSCSTGLNNSQELHVSRLGKAAIKGCIDLSIASELYNDLVAARDHLALHSHLHLLYLVTPYTASEVLPFKADVFSMVYNDLTEQCKGIAKILGFTEAIVVKLSIGQQPKKFNKEITQRFYVTMAIHRIMNGDSVHTVSQIFKTHRGVIQQLLMSAGAFASCVNNFCQGLEELWAYQDLLMSFSKKVSSYCNAELLPLLELPAIKIGRARMLFKSGFCSVSDIARADAKDLVNAIDHLSYKTAYQLISSAKMLLLQKAEALQEQAHEVLMGLRD